MQPKFDGRYKKSQHKFAHYLEERWRVQLDVQRFHKYVCWICQQRCGEINEEYEPVGSWI